MAKIQFSHPQSQKVWKHIETASARSHHNPRQAFEDFLTMVVSALSGGRMEQEYLKAVEAYTKGEAGNRGCDFLAMAFGELVIAMESTGKDIMGDIFEAAITRGENGQFLTPENLCAMMAAMTGESGENVCDPCCGSGRLLLAAADINRSREFVGQDIDFRCVQMTGINLALRNLSGYVIRGNTLTNEKWAAFRTGFNGKGFIAPIKIEECPEPVKQLVERTPDADPQIGLF